MATEKSTGPNHSTRSTNKKLPGIVKPGPVDAKPRVKITQAPPPAPQPKL